MIGIYSIISPKGMVYIGASTNTYNRMYWHRGNKSRTSRLLSESFLMYGVDSHVFSVVCECEAADLPRLERYYQDHYDALGVSLNLRKTGYVGKRGAFCDKSKRLMSDTHKANWANGDWKVIRRKGFVCSAATKELMSKAKIGKGAVYACFDKNNACAGCTTINHFIERGFSRSAIYQAVNKKIGKYKGLVWKRITDGQDIPTPDYHILI